MTKARDLADLGNGVTEADIAASNSATNGYMLTAQSGNTGGLTWAEAPSSFAPVAVTGATPSLNVGTFNFFDNGTITGNTTVSFASVPTNAKWQYSFKGSILSGFLLTGATTAGAVKYLGNEEGAPRGISFKPDGLKLYTVGSTSDAVDQYTLSTAWDATTATYDSVTFSVASQENNPQGINFKPDGTEMYIVGHTGTDVNQYTLSTAWDISSASFTGLYSVNSQETAPKAVVFKPDGLTMYVVGTTTDDVFQYTLSTAWLVSSASYASKSLDINPQGANPTGLFFKPDGLALFVGSDSGDAVFKYTLSTAWDLATASYASETFTTINNPKDMTFSEDGQYLYALGQDANIYRYNTVQAYTTLTLPSSVQNTPTVAVENKRATYEFFTMDGGTTVTLIGEEIV